MRYAETVGALTYEEREEKVEEEVGLGGVESGLESLANRCGMRRLIEAVVGLAKHG